MMYDWFKEEKVLCFIGGVVAGLVGFKVLKAKKTREFAVQALANGMMVKDEIMEEVANIREEADDICNEAKAVARKNSENEETVVEDVVEE